MLLLLVPIVVVIALVLYTQRARVKYIRVPHLLSIELFPVSGDKGTVAPSDVVRDDDAGLPTGEGD
jgi:hypothetical protein